MIIPNDVLRQMNDIGGIYSEKEAEQLYKYVMGLDESGLVVEVGCERGKSTSVLASAAKERGVAFYVVDSWVYDRDRNEPAFWENMRRLGLEDTFEFVEKDSALAAYDFDDKSIDLLHLDSDHKYDYSVKELAAWRPKMARDGIICFHDYARPAFANGIKKVVDEAVARKELLLFGVYDSLGVFLVMK